MMTRKNIIAVGIAKVTLWIKRKLHCRGITQQSLVAHRLKEADR